MRQPLLIKPYSLSPTGAALSLNLEFVSEGQSYKDQVGLAIVVCRRRSGDLTGEEFARRLGLKVGQKITGPQLSNWEHGKVSPGAHILAAALDLAGVPLLPILTAARVDDVESRLAELERKLTD